MYTAMRLGRIFYLAITSYLLKNEIGIVLAGFLDQ
jgi:hypothetical protein